MKKLLASVLALVFMLALTACGETKGSGEPIAGGAVSDMPNTDTSTIETEQSQPTDTSIEDSTPYEFIVHGNAEEKVNYSLKELESMKDALEPYMSEYGIVILDANETTKTVDIIIQEEKKDIYELIDSLDIVDLSAVRIAVCEDVVLQYT